MNTSLAALAPMLVALVIVVALAIDVLIRLRRLAQGTRSCASAALPTGRPTLSLVPSARAPRAPGDFDAMEAADEAAQAAQTAQAALQAREAARRRA